LILDEAPQRREELTPGDFVGWLLEASGLFAMYEGDAEDRVARRENLQQLAAAVAEAAARGQELEELLDSVALLEENDEQGAADGVALMTLHSAKGLEFDIVFLAGLEDGLLPHANSRDEPEGLEEERRLCQSPLPAGVRRPVRALWHVPVRPEAVAQSRRSGGEARHRRQSPTQTAPAGGPENGSATSASVQE